MVTRGDTLREFELGKPAQSGNKSGTVALRYTVLSLFVPLNYADLRWFLCKAETLTYPELEIYARGVMPSTCWHLLYLLTSKHPPMFCRTFAKFEDRWLRLSLDKFLEELDGGHIHEDLIIGCRYVVNGLVFLHFSQLSEVWQEHEGPSNWQQMTCSRSSDVVSRGRTW